MRYKSNPSPNNVESTAILKYFIFAREFNISSDPWPFLVDLSMTRAYAV
jgi:hypothetical protein